MPDESQGFSMFEYAKRVDEKPLVKLADVIKPAPKAMPGPPVPAPAGMTVDPKDDGHGGVIWSYKKTEKTPEPEPVKEKDFTPGFDFSEKVSVEGKERKIELAASGLYVFDKKEKFDKPKTELPMKHATPHGAWIGVRRPYDTGRLLVPAASKPSDFRTVKVRGKDIKGILELTQPKKR